MNPSMSRAITESKKLLNRYAPLVVVIALLQVPTHLGITSAIVTTVGIVVALCLEIALYSRIATYLQGESYPAIPDALKRNALNYLMVLVVLFAPVLCLQVVLRVLDVRGIEAIMARNMFTALIAGLSVYVLPMVFLRGTNVSAIPAGFAYLFRNLADSLSLLGLVAMHYACVFLAALVSVHFSSYVGLTSVVNVGASLVSTALTVLVFSAATYVICGNSRPGGENFTIEYEQQASV